MLKELEKYDNGNIPHVPTNPGSALLLVPTSVTDLQHVKCHLWSRTCRSVPEEVTLDQCLPLAKSVRLLTLYSPGVDLSWLQAVCGLGPPAWWALFLMPPHAVFLWGHLPIHIPGNGREKCIDSFHKQLRSPYSPPGIVSGTLGDVGMCKRWSLPKECVGASGETSM